MPMPPKTTSLFVDDALAGVRLDIFLSTAIASLSRTRAKALILEGQVSIDGAIVADPKKTVTTGVEITLAMPDAIPAEPEAEDIALDVLFEDEHLILINKPAGMTVHPAPGNWTGTLVNALLHHCAGQLSGIGGVMRPGIVHRIDKLTSGVLVAAKTEAAHAGLSKLFATHDIERSYRAVLRGAPMPLAGTVEEWIARDTRDRKRMAIVPEDSGKGRSAITHYKIIEQFGEQIKGTGEPAACLAACTLETGRTHQIRVHMAHLGTPLVGDPVYSRFSGVKAWGRHAAFESAAQTIRAFPRQALHAATLGFIHPITGETLSVEAPPPVDFEALLGALRRL